MKVTDETGSAFFFRGSATAGELTVFNNPGSYLAFHDSSNAGSATFNISGAGIRQGNLDFWDDATAADASIANHSDGITLAITPGREQQLARLKAMDLSFSERRLSRSAATTRAPAFLE